MKRFGEEEGGGASEERKEREKCGVSILYPKPETLNPLMLRLKSWKKGRRVRAKIVQKLFIAVIRWGRRLAGLVKWEWPSADCLSDIEQCRTSWKKTTKLNHQRKRRTTQNDVVRNHAQRTWEDDENHPGHQSSSALILLMLKIAF